MNVEQDIVRNIEAARHLFEEAGRGRFEAMAELIAENVIDHTPLPGMPAGRDGIAEAWRGARASASHFELRIEDVVAEGDYVAVRWIATGWARRLAPGFGAFGPHRPPVAAGGTDIVRLRDGRVVERWGSCDLLGAFVQAGIAERDGLRCRLADNCAAARPRKATAPQAQRQRIRERLHRYVTGWQLPAAWMSPLPA